jgi:hypothetical protein
MLNHFHYQGIRYLGSEVFLRTAAIRVTPVLLLTAGLLAMRHARSVPSAYRFGIRQLVVSSCAWCAIALMPLVALEIELYPRGHGGASVGLSIALRHLPFVGVFLAGVWSVGKIYRSDRAKLLAILAPAPAGYLFGFALVYAILFAREVAFHWGRCRDAGGLTQFAMCFF